MVYDLSWFYQCLRDSAGQDAYSLIMFSAGETRTSSFMQPIFPNCANYQDSVEKSIQHGRAELVETRVCFTVPRLRPFENIGECRIPSELIGGERIKIRQLDHS